MAEAPRRSNKGQPLAIFDDAERQTLLERLERRILRTDEDDCWRWTGQHVPKGYGQIKIGGRKGRNIYVHRLMYALKFGRVGLDELVLHECDTPSCCNPAHLFLGTHAGNSADMRAKGRQALGVRKPSAKLTEEMVRAIRADPRSGREVACEYGLSFKQVARIRRRENWKHLR